MPPKWRRGPMGRTVMLVKQFSMSRLDFGQRVWKGNVMNTSSWVNSGEYLQGLLVHQVIIWSEGFSDRKELREPRVRVIKII